MASKEREHPTKRTRNTPRRLKTRIKEEKALTKARIETEIKARIKATKKYANEELKKLIPYELRGLASGFIDYVDLLLSKADVIEIGGFMLGITSGLKFRMPANQIFIMGLSGLFAVRGLSTESEAVGAASIATLIFLGAAIAGSGTELMMKTIVKNRERVAELETASPERKEAIIEELKRSIQDMNSG